MIRHNQKSIVSPARRSLRRSAILRRAAQQAMEMLEPRQMLAAHIVGISTVYSTIQAAVNAASAGATINVDAGTYNESVTISKTLTLRGAKAGVDARGRSTTGESIVTGASGTAGIGFSFDITASDVTLDGFTVQGETSKSTTNGAGIVLAPSVSGTHILDNIIQNNVAGVYLANSSATDAALFQHNVFQNNNNAGVNGGRGIYTDAGLTNGTLTNVTIDSNTFTNNHGGSGTTGLEAAVAIESQTPGQQSNFTITNNTFTNNGKSVLFFNTTGVVLEGNTASGAQDWYSGSFRFEGNDHNVTIEFNNIINNPGPGVAVDSSGTPGDSSGFVVSFNNITGNGTNSAYTSPLGVVYNQTQYDGTFDARNNWWGNANGPSGDGPGTGNSVYGNANKTGHWNVATGGSELFSPWSTSPNSTTISLAPTAPGSLVAIASGANQINLTWANTSSSATGVKIERSIDGVNFTPVITVSGTTSSYADTNLSAGTTYYYRVRATNSAGDSQNSNVANATTAASNAPATYLSDLTPTSATTGYGTVMKDLSVGGNTITLAGVTYAKGIGAHAVSNITYNLAGAYQTFQSDVGIDAEEDGKGTGSVEFIVLADGKNVFDSGVLTNDQVKHITLNITGVNTLTLEALNGVPNSIDFDHADWAGAVIYGTPTVPVAPPNLAAIALSSTSVKLSWSAGAASVISYTVDRSTDGTNFATVATGVSGTATSWTDPATLVANTKYYYRIRATNAAGASANSNTASVTTPAANAVTTYLSDLTPTSATTGFGTIMKDKSVSGNTITIAGQTYTKGIGAHAVSNITYNLAGGYQTFQSDAGIDSEEDGKGVGSVDFQVIGDGKVLFDSGVLTNGQVAHISVSVAGVQTLTLVATNGVPNSIDYDHADWGGAAVIGTPAVPATPANLTAVAVSSTSIKLTWSAGAANITSYQIDRSTDGTNFTTVATNVAGSATTWTDPATLIASTKYYYRIRAVNSVGTSLNSNVASATTLSATSTTTFLSDLTPTSATTGYGSIMKDLSVNGNPLTLNGTVYTKGIGAHAVSNITYNLAGNYSTFLATVGVDDEENGKGVGSVDFQIIGDGKVLFDSGVLQNGNAPVNINISVAGVQTLTLVATNGIPNNIDFDHADWANARLLN